MANNGGTLNGVPQQPQRGLNNSCNACRMTFDSTDSLQVHIHYQHTENSQNRWSHSAPTLTSNASNSPTDSENNNQPKHYIQQQKTVSSPLNSTISAAADSSDNQPPTPQPTIIDQSQTTRLQSHVFNNSPYQNQSHQQLQPQPTEIHYPSYMHTSYDQYYHQHSMEYGIPPPPTHFLGNTLTPAPPQLHQEYKPVPSTPRFHPYGHHHTSGSVTSVHHPYHQHVQPVISSVASTQSAISPRVVTSSSPIQMHSTTAPSSSASNVNTTPPTSSPRQCDKCGHICDSIAQLNEHHTSAHSAVPTAENETTDTINNRNSGGDIENEIPSYQYISYVSRNVKEEPECDILDLDSQKMVYPPHDLNQPQQGPLPPMHSLHPIQRSMMWPHGSSHDFLSISQSSTLQEMKPGMYGSVKNEFSPQIVKQEGHHVTQMPSNQQTTSPNVSKSYINDVSASQVATSPSEFPSTTTPQDNNSQFRTYEAATSSLPSSATVIKATSWKSNEARRPKTYNCTACNKWFTSSGHLKRHYNTTLHKNAVKSSGQPDPATLPISVHHHPARDPNSKHHHRHNSNNSNSNNNVMVQQQAPQSIMLTDSTRTPDFQPQYTSPSMGFQHSQHPMDTGGFSQYASQTQSDVTIPPNAQAGLSVLAFQPRGLLNYSNITGMHQSPEHQLMLPQQQPLPHSAHQQQSEQDFIPVVEPQVLPESTIITNSMGVAAQSYNIITPITINTNITQSYQDIQQPEEHQQTFHTIIGKDTALIRVNSDSDENLSIQNDESSSRTTVLHSYNNDGVISTTSPLLSNIENQHESIGQQSYQLIKSEYIDDVYHNYDDIVEYSRTRLLSTTTKLPVISAIRGHSDIYHADTVPPFSPDVPEKKALAPYHLLYNDRSLTPQTGEIVPAHLSPNGPSSHRHSDMSMTSAISTTIINEPGSPRVTSTNTSIETDLINLSSNVKAKTKSSTAKRRAKGDINLSATRPTVDVPITTNAIRILSDGEVTFKDPLRCEPCDKVFNKACYLTQHNKTFHSGEKPYKCQRCGKRFPCDQSHDEHLAKHINMNKAFKCNQCIKQFNHKTDLRRHMCLHSGLLPYQCNICKKGFIRKDHMVKHGLTHLKRKQNDAHVDDNSQFNAAKNCTKANSKRHALDNTNKKRKKPNSE